MLDSFWNEFVELCQKHGIPTSRQTCECGGPDIDIQTTFVYQGRIFTHDQLNQELLNAVRNGADPERLGTAQQLTAEVSLHNIKAVRIYARANIQLLYKQIQEQTSEDITEEGRAKLFNELKQTVLLLIENELSGTVAVRINFNDTDSTDPDSAVKTRLVH